MPDAVTPVFAGKVHPMLFNGSMVRAILREIASPGTGKTVTRRLITPQPLEWEARVIDIKDPVYDEDEGGWGQWETIWDSMITEPLDYTWRHLRVHYSPGDLIYVREICWLYGQWQEVGVTATGKTKRSFDMDGRTVMFDKPGIDNLAFWRGGPGFSWRPAMHHPRWASRLTLHVGDVRVERLRDITEEDAIREGLSSLSKDGGRVWKWGIPDRDGLPGNDDGMHWKDWSVDPRDAFARLWDSTKPKLGFRWKDNPWVSVIRFRPELANVDDVLARLGAEVGR